ncbi:hypothetical protein B0T19DRAFT_142219 [Cercophora scortea]|uniref:Protein kinase domain-containing protein n=1 Tax=Cercophora scortea TaxID=314031 RepID=A0AAE0IZ87_9PEZI|nr:hypothetical protein B0T19DRAFT_142219 [Cercophora scortea]
MPGPIVNVESNPEGPGGRSMGTWLQKGGQAAVALLEWTTVEPKAFLAYLEDVEERIPTGEGPRAALMYRCSQQPADLRDVLLKVQKPSGEDRRALSRIIATQVRSLHVHFQLPHPCLRTESFVLFGNAEKPDLTKPYVLDWARPPSNDIYRHPGYQADKSLWFYQAWSLLMVLSEIAEWRPLDRASSEDKEEKLLRRKMERKQLVTRPDWKGAPTAEIFKYGFGFLERDHHTRGL